MPSKIIFHVGRNPVANLSEFRPIHQPLPRLDRLAGTSHDRLIQE